MRDKAKAAYSDESRYYPFRVGLKMTQTFYRLMISWISIILRASDCVEQIRRIVSSLPLSGLTKSSSRTRLSPWTMASRQTLWWIRNRWEKNRSKFAYKSVIRLLKLRRKYSSEMEKDDPSCFGFSPRFLVCNCFWFGVVIWADMNVNKCSYFGPICYIYLLIFIKEKSNHLRSDLNNLEKLSANSISTRDRLSCSWPTIIKWIERMSSRKSLKFRISDPAVTLVLHSNSLPNGSLPHPA